MTGRRREAEEIAQEAYVLVLERWDHIQRLSDPTGYLFVAALNVLVAEGDVLARDPPKAPVSTGDRPAEIDRYAPSLYAFGAVEDRAVVLGASAQPPTLSGAALKVTALLGYSSEEARASKRGAIEPGP
jgi:DNA-directed RNA polymerase specialized sigma24 family protein